MVSRSIYVELTLIHEGREETAFHHLYGRELTGTLLEAGRLRISPSDIWVPLRLQKVDTLNRQQCTVREVEEICECTLLRGCV